MATWSSNKGGAHASLAEGTSAYSVEPASNPPLANLNQEQLKNAGMASKLLMASFGEIVSVLLRSHEYRDRPLSALEEIAIPAALTGQFSLAQAQSAVNGMVASVGVVFWARVSPEVDKRLVENISAPLKLSTREWRSGSIIWIVDAVGEHKVVEAMLSRLLEMQWTGQEVRLRARTKDGSYKLGVLGRGYAKANVAPSN